MSEIMEQEERRDTDDVGGSGSYAKKRKKQEIEYTCGCRYLFNHETVLVHICSEHERELITLHG
jgi:hypothetical protein